LALNRALQVTSFDLVLLGESAAIHASQILCTNGIHDSDLDDRGRGSSLRGGEDVNAEDSKKIGTEDEEEERTGEKNQEDLFSKNLLNGAAGTSGHVLPSGDDGVRKDRPAYLPESGEEGPEREGAFYGGRIARKNESENANACESENAHESENARLTTYEDLILRVSQVAQQRSAAPTRRPSPMIQMRTDERTQTVDGSVNPASQSEICEPLLHPALSRLEHMVRNLCNAQSQATSERKTVRRAWRRREKRRKKRAVLGDGEVTCQSLAPERPPPVSVNQGINARKGDGDASAAGEQQIESQVKANEL
jgi:hypothetical protein